MVFADRLPDGSVAETFAGVMGYLDPSGNMAYAVIHAGNAPMSTFVGLLVIAERKIIEHFEAGQGQDDAG